MNRYDFCMFTLGAAITLVGSAASGEHMGQPTTNGGSAIYLDIDSEGRILEVDQLTKSAKQLGSISDIHSESLAYSTGITFSNRQYALLFFHEVQGPRYPPETPYLFSRTKGTLQRSPISFLLIGDGAIIPLDSHSIFVSGTDPETMEVVGTIYDAVTNKKRGSFDFRVSPYTISSRIMENRYAYFAERGGPIVRRVDVPSGAVDQEYSLIDFVEPDTAGDGTRVSVRALHRDFALVSRWFPEKKSSKLFMVDMKNERVTAQSEFLTGIGIHFLIIEDGQGNIILKCIQKIEGESGVPATGVIFTFSIAGDFIEAQGTESFDPESQIVVTDESGAPVIIPRYEFDYLSMREIQREIFRRLPTAALGSIKERKRIRDEVIEEFNNPEQEGFTSRNRTHLEIR